MIEFVKSIKAKLYKENRFQDIDIKIPVEVSIDIHLNNKKFVSILCTPIDIKHLIIGFLYSENIIRDIKEVKNISINENNYEVNVILDNFPEIPKEKVLTSGFGKGVMFKKEGEKVISNYRIKPKKITKLMKEFIENLKIYKISGAVHASCIADENKVILIKEDIGRHNTFDKIAGECLDKEISTKDKIIFTTGRISTEMLLKSSRMQIPIVATMKSPTENCVKIAKNLNITVIGKVKEDNFIVFCNDWRVDKF